MFSRPHFLLALGVAVIAPMCAAQEPPPPAAPPTTKSAPQIKELGDGRFQVGAVTLDKNTRSVTFPGAINMTEGLIEYLLVARGGKTHESLFVTGAEPYHIHVAMLLLGAKGAPNDGELDTPPSQIDAAFLKKAPAVQGDKVLVLARWKTGGNETTVNGEDLVINDKEKHTARRGPWTYNGSRFYHGNFAAQMEGSIIAMVTDPTALVNNPRPGHDDDMIWEIDPKKVPPKDTPVEITIKLEGPKP
jgi:hypothetical protein